MKNGIALMVVLFLTFASGLFLGRHMTGGEGSSGRTDTVYVSRPVKGENPLPSSVTHVGYLQIPRVLFRESEGRTDTLLVPVSVHSVDSLPVHDTTSVYLPKEQKYYNLENGDLEIWASGYGVNIDMYRMERQTQIIRRRDRFNLSASVGYGIGNNGLTPMIGLTLGYTIFSF